MTRGHHLPVGTHLFFQRNRREGPMGRPRIGQGGGRSHCPPEHDVDSAVRGNSRFRAKLLRFLPFSLSSPPLRSLLRLSSFRPPLSMLSA